MAPTLDSTRPRIASFTRLATVDSCLFVGMVSLFAGIAGSFDNGGDALILGVFGLFATGAAGFAHRTMDRRHRPSPSRVLSGLAFSWIVVVVLGAGLYLITGTIDEVHNAIVESAAGFSTTSVTTLNPEELSLTMQFFRSGTQWIGGLIGIIVAVVSMPLVLRGGMLSESLSVSGERLVPNPELGRQRVAIIYSSLTVAMLIGYLITGLGTRDSIVHAMTTISTGGFSSHADSFVSFGTGPRIVAGIGMFIGGASYFAVWWAVRGRVGPLWRSTELRVYVGMLTACAVLIALGGDGLSAGDAAFSAVSAMSTTGFAVGDWTLLDDSVLMVLLIVIGTGSMSGSAGGGLRVVRAWTLVGFASRELRRQLDPHAIVVVKQGGSAVPERVLDRTVGYQVAHLGLCGAAAFLLALSGVDLLGALYTGISVLSTHGPGVGTGAFGDLSDFSALGRLSLVPFMLAGRLTILPLLLALSFLFRMRTDGIRQTRRLVSGASIR